MIKLEKADKQFLSKNNIDNNAYICKDNENVIGICEYLIKENTLFLEAITCDDNSIADGLIRQTMSNSLDNGIEECRFSEKAAEKLFELRIIKDKNTEKIDILDFFLKLNCI